jgi:hypothetical protein
MSPHLVCGGKSKDVIIGCECPLRSVMNAGIALIAQIALIVLQLVQERDDPGCNTLFLQVLD